MNERENYLKTLTREGGEWTPVAELPILVQRGFRDWFEKGPAGGGLDGFGVMWKATDSGDGAVVPDNHNPVLKNIADWEEVVFPDLDSIDWESKAAKDLEGVDRSNTVLEYGMGNGPFERLCDLMGIANALYAMIKDPESCEKLIEAHTEYRIKLVEKVAKYYKPDIITIYDDVALQDSLFISPKIYRRLFSPSHKKVNDAIKSHGIIAIQHCCGKAEAIIEDFIAEGAMAWTSVQPCNDINGLIEKYGDKITIIGGFDSNGQAGGPDGTMEERLEEVRRAVREYSGKGSFIVGNVNILTGKGAEYANEVVRQLAEEGLRYSHELAGK